MDKPEVHTGKGSTKVISGESSGVSADSVVITEPSGETTIRLRGGGSENVQIKRRPDHTVDGVTIIVGRSVEVVIS